MSKKEVNVGTLAQAFLSMGTQAAKIAPQVRALIGNLEGDALETKKKSLYDAIRETGDGRNEKGQLVAWSKVSAPVRAAYDAAKMAISRAVRARDAKDRGPIKRLSVAQKAYNVAHDMLAALRKAEDCPAELVAAFEAVRTKAIALGATAKEAKAK